MPIRDFVLSAIILALVPICFLRPWIGALVWSWLGFMNPHKLTWGFARDMPFAQIVGLAFLTGLLFTKDKKPIAWNAEIVLLLVLLAYFTMTTFFAWAPSYAWLEWKKVATVIVMAIALSAVIYGRYRIRSLLIVIALSLGFFGVKGAWFVIRTGGVFSVRGPEGTFIGDNNTLALALVTVIPLLIALAREESIRWRRIGFNFIMICCIISAVFSYSRGALIGLAVVLPLTFWSSKHRVRVLLLVMPLIIGHQYVMKFLPEELLSRAETIETYEEDASAMQRIQAWSVAWNIALERPFVGAGFDFEYSSGDVNGRWLSYADFMIERGKNVARAAHSIYFQILGQHGFIALGLFVWLLFGTLWRSRRLKKVAARNDSTQWIRSYLTGIQIGIAGYMITGAFLSLAYFDLFYVLVILVALLERELRSVTVTADAAVQDWRGAQLPVNDYGRVIASDQNEISRGQG